MRLFLSLSLPLSRSPSLHAPAVDALAHKANNNAARKAV